MTTLPIKGMPYQFDLWAPILELRSCESEAVPASVARLHGPMIVVSMGLGKM